MWCRWKKSIAALAFTYIYMWTDCAHVYRVRMHLLCMHWTSKSRYNQYQTTFKLRSKIFAEDFVHFRFLLSIDVFNVLFLTRIAHTSFVHSFMLSHALLLFISRYNILNDGTFFCLLKNDEFKIAVHYRSKESIFGTKTTRKNHLRFSASFCSIGKLSEWNKCENSETGWHHWNKPAIELMRINIRVWSSFNKSISWITFS